MICAGVARLVSVTCAAPLSVGAGAEAIPAGALATAVLRAESCHAATAAMATNTPLPATTSHAFDGVPRRALGAAFAVATSGAGRDIGAARGAGRLCGPDVAGDKGGGRDAAHDAGCDSGPSPPCDGRAGAVAASGAGAEAGLLRAGDPSAAPAVSTGGASADVAPPGVAFAADPVATGLDGGNPVAAGLMADAGTAGPLVGDAAAAPAFVADVTAAGAVAGVRADAAVAALACVGDAVSTGADAAVSRCGGTAPRSDARGGATSVVVVARAVGIGAVGLKVVVFASDAGATRAVGMCVGR